MTGTAGCLSARALQVRNGSGRATEAFEMCCAQLAGLSARMNRAHENEFL
jgi:hypothetical protein